MNRRSLAKTLKGGILLFWSFWFSIVCLTNLFDLLRSLAIISPNWPMVSGNFSLLQKTTSVYHFGEGFNTFLFAGVVVWEALSAAFFWLAFIRFFRSEDLERQTDAILRAFFCGITLFAAFAISCEIFLTYEIEGVHVSIFTALLISLIVVRMLPEP